MRRAWVLVGLALAVSAANAPIASARGARGPSSGSRALLDVAQAADAAALSGPPVAGASAAEPVPPDLQALEPRMLALKPNTARFSLTLSAEFNPRVRAPFGPFGRVFGKASAVRQTLLEASGEVSARPPQAAAQLSFLGLSTNVRLIGTTLYLEDPSLKRLDGGRPWVEKRGETLHGALGDQLGGGFQTDPSSGFGGLVKIVQGARAIRELGPATVDGQPTTGFRLSVDLLAREKKLSARRRRALRKAVHPLATVELFIAENGLPVRSRITVRLRHAQGEVILQLDIPVIEIPVSVQPPPPAETISEAKLDRLLARLQAHRHRRHAHRRRS